VRRAGVLGAVLAALLLVVVVWTARASRLRGVSYSDAPHPHGGGAVQVGSGSAVPQVSQGASTGSAEGPEGDGVHLTEEEIESLKADPGTFVFGMTPLATPETNYTADPAYQDIVGRRSAESTDDYVRRLWGYYYDGHHLRYQGQALVTIGQVLRLENRDREAEESLRLAMNLQSEGAYFAPGPMESFRQQSFRSEHDWNQFTAWAEHYTLHPDRAGEWARLELAQICVARGQSDRAKRVWEDIIARRPHDQYCEADRAFLAKASPLTVFNSSFEGAGPDALDEVPRPETMALAAWVAQAEKEGSFGEAYSAYKRALDTLGGAANLQRIHRLASLARQAGENTESVAWLRKGIELCDAAQMANRASATPAGMRQWDNWREILQEEVSPPLSGTK